MASLRETIETTIQIEVNSANNEADERSFVAQFARDSIKGLIQQGLFPQTYTRYVDDIEGAPEEAVKLNHGKIVYEGTSILEAVAFALGFLAANTPIGPVQGGHLKEDWFVSVDGRPWTADLSTIPDGANIMITNFRAYARKVDIRDKMTESARQATQRRFPTVYVGRTFVAIPGGYVRTDGEKVLFPALTFVPA
jgi:hypothetical protein